MKTILNLITQCGKTIRAPEQTLLPMTKEQDADWKLYHSRRAASQPPIESASPTSRPFEARSNGEQSK